MRQGLHLAVGYRQAQAVQDPCTACRQCVRTPAFEIPVMTVTCAWSPDAALGVPALFLRNMSLYAADELIGADMGHHPGKKLQTQAYAKPGRQHRLWQISRSDPSKYPQGFRTSTLYLMAQAHIQPYQIYKFTDLGCLHRYAIARYTHRRNVRHGPREIVLTWVSQVLCERVIWHDISTSSLRPAAFPACHRDSQPCALGLVRAAHTVLRLGRTALLRTHAVSCPDRRTSASMGSLTPSDPEENAERDREARRREHARMSWVSEGRWIIETG